MSEPIDLIETIEYLDSTLLFNRTMVECKKLDTNGVSFRSLGEDIEVEINEETMFYDVLRIIFYKDNGIIKVMFNKTNNVNKVYPLSTITSLRVY